MARFSDMANIRAMWKRCYIDGFWLWPDSGRVAAWTVSEVQAKLAEWKAAETKVAEGQAYSIGNRMMTRADLPAIAERIKYYSGLLQDLERGGIRIRRGVPV